MMTEVEIVIYTHRWSALQVEAITSIALRTMSNIKYSIIVQQEPVSAHENMARAWKRVSAPYVVYLDEDVQVLQPRWLESLVKVLKERKDIGVLGTEQTRSNLDLVPQLSDDLYVKKEKWIPGHVMAFDRTKVPDLAFDTNIPGRCGMTDLDACLQVRKAGYLVSVLPQVVVYHPMRDDDRTRKIEGRPLISEMKSWYLDQHIYMLSKWGDFYRDAIE